MPEKEKLELGRGPMDGGREGTAQCVLKGRHAVLVPAFGTSEKAHIPGGPVTSTPHSHCRSPGSIPDQGTRFHMLQLKIA